MPEPYLVTLAPSGLEPAQTGYHALFAARVHHWPYGRMAQHTWDTRQHEIQVQLLERQLRFLTALQPVLPLPPEQHLGLELRYVRRPEAAAVECALVGKAHAPTAEAAQAAARAWWRTLGELLPLGYELQAADTQTEFSHWAGYDLASQAKAPEAWAFFRQRAEFLPWTDIKLPVRHLPIIYPFSWRLNGWDGIWLALSRTEAPSLVAVNLQFKQLETQDVWLVAQVVRELEEVASAASAPLRLRAEEATVYYRRYLHSAQTLFQVQIAAIGQPGLFQAVAHAFDGPEWGELYKATHNFVSVECLSPTADRLAGIRTHFAVLEPVHWPHTDLPLPFERLRNCVDPMGAVSAFRLPLMPPAGYPGVQVGWDIAPPLGSA